MKVKSMQEVLYENKIKVRMKNVMRKKIKRRREKLFDWISIVFLCIVMTCLMFFINKLNESAMNSCLKEHDKFFCELKV